MREYYSGKTTIDDIGSLKYICLFAKKHDFKKNVQGTLCVGMETNE